MADADLQWRAQVIDDTFTFFQRFDENLERIANTSEAQFARVDQAASGSGKEIGLVAGVVGGLTSKLAEMGIQAVGALKSFISESIQLRARVDTLGVSLGTVARNAGYSANEIGQFEKDVKSMGITTQATRQNLLRMAQANLDLNRSAELARIAQDAAVIAGVNSSDAFQRVLYAVTTLQPEMLRNLGIVVNAQQEYTKFANAADMAAKDLTYQQKQQVFLNAAIQAGTRISGTYESAMGSVGKQMTSLPRYIEEVQLALGEAFQPALSAQMGFMTGQLKELQAWLEENKEEIQRFSEMLGKLVVSLFEFLGGLVDFAKTLPGYVEEAGAILAKAIGQLTGVASPEEIEKRRSKLGQYFGEFASLIAAGLAMVVKAISEALKMVGDAVTLFLQKFHLIKGDWEATYDSMTERANNFEDMLGQAFEDALLSTGQFMGVIEEVPEAIEEVADSAESAGSGMQSLSDAMEEVGASFASLKQEMEEEIAKRLKKEARDAEREALRLSHSIEDIERKHVERLDQLAEKGRKSREALEKRGRDNERKLVDKHAQSMIDAQRDVANEHIDIERDYRQQLRSIQDEFDFQAEDAARRNDAITMIRLMRQRKRQVEEARTSADTQHDEANRNLAQKEQELRKSLARERSELAQDLQERLLELEASLDEQLVATMAQRDQDYENLRRSLDRKRELEMLSRRFADEDRQAAYRKQLSDMVAQFASMEGLTHTGLQGMLNEWGEYFGDLGFMMDEFDKRRGGAPRTMPTRPSGPLEERPRDRYGGYVTGQAGIHSRMLSPDYVGGRRFTWQVPQVSVAPPVPARSSTERREVNLSGDVSGLDPYMQRVLVNGLMEIERNA